MADAPSPRTLIFDCIGGSRRTQCLYVAARLELADRLKDKPQTAEQLATATGTHGPSLYRLLRALASIGIFAEDEQGRFHLTPAAEYLRRGVPGSLQGLAVMAGEEHYHSWGELLYSVQTGRTGFERVYGKPIFSYLAEHPREAQIFDDAMVSVHGPETATILDAYDLSSFGTLVDIGGGNGSVLIEALRRHPRLRGVLFDRPDVVERARPLLEKAVVADRCQTVGGNFFESVPAGGDAYLLRHIIHDWYDPECLTILGHVRRVIPPAGKLLVIEPVIPPGNGPFNGKFQDLTMLVVPGGKERTEAEYRALHAKAGFRLARIVPTRSEVSVIEGVPV
jgi:hypothetical protein